MRLPAIISDIDGVVKKGAKRIEGSEKVIESALTPFVDPKTSKVYNLPFCLLSNGGG